MTDDVRVGLDFSEHGLRLAMLIARGARFDALALGVVSFDGSLLEAVADPRAHHRRVVIARAIREFMQDLQPAVLRLALRPPLAHAFLSRTDDADGIRFEAELLGFVDARGETILSADAVRTGSDDPRYLVTVTPSHILESLAEIAEAAGVSDAQAVSGARAEAEVLQRAGVEGSGLTVLPSPYGSESDYPPSIDQAVLSVAGVEPDAFRTAARPARYTVAIGAALLG